MRILVVAAHPDDEILGVGGSILRHTAMGDEVYVCIVTKAFEPEWSREYMATKLIEQKKVDRILCIKKRFSLGFLTTRLNTVPHGEICKAITDVITAIKPAVLYTHFEGDLNCDHGVVFRACMVASRPPKRIRVLCFETLSETEWGNKVFLPNIWIDISRFTNKKIKAFCIYKSEGRLFPHPRSREGIEALAKKRGTEICTNYAEAFMLVREVVT